MARSATKKATRVISKLVSLMFRLVGLFDDRESIIQAVKNNTRQETPPFIEQEDEGKANGYSEDDLHKRPQKWSSVEQIHNMAYAKSNRRN